MRILYHHRTLADGAEGVHIAAMVDAFRELGHEVYIAHPPGQATSNRRRHLIERVRASLPRAAFELASVAYNTVEYARLRDQMRRCRPDFAYVRHSRFDVAAVEAAAGLRVPSVLEVNVLFSTPRYAQYDPLALAGLARAMERWALKRASLVLTVSSPLADDVFALAGVAARVVPNGADPVRFDPHRASRRDIRRDLALGEGLIVGWTGIVREWHGLELLLDAVASIPAARLLIVGDGPGRAAFEDRARALSLQSRVTVTGRVENAAIADYIAAMDVTVVADERTGVASPMKLLEYMAMARPVVAPRQPNIRDLIDDGVDGLLFEPGSVDELRGLLARLAADPSLRGALGLHARAKVESQRNWRHIGESVIAAVNDAVSRRRNT